MLQLMKNGNTFYFEKKAMKNDFDSSRDNAIEKSTECIRNLSSSLIIT